jgi:hypothetical protein
VPSKAILISLYLKGFFMPTLDDLGNPDTLRAFLDDVARDALADGGTRPPGDNSGLSDSDGTLKAWFASLELPDEDTLIRHMRSLRF